jgi:hypothetical protein
MIKLNCQFCDCEISSVEFSLDDLITCESCW